MSEKKFEVGEKLLQAVVDYLGRKPYAEVAGMLSELLNTVNKQLAEKPKSKKEK